MPDYGNGLTNVDKATGIRFGVIPQRDLHEWAYEAFELVYPEPCCPKCGDEAQGIAGAQQDYDERNVDKYGEDDLPELSPLREHSCDDYGCAKCGVYFGSDDLGDVEPIGQRLDDGEYVATAPAGSFASDDDVFIERSPFYTFAPFCSPCAPGAVYLRDAGPAGDARGYCFGHDWFAGGVAPYPVFSVADGSEIYPVGLSF